MAKKNSLSKRARSLLSAGEGPNLDYKRDVESITVEDLCAFANMPDGGCILAGVAEDRAAAGNSIGRVVGCSISDSSQLVLVNKSQQCHPPIPLSLQIESDGELSFLRVEIQPTGQGPHCTPSGRYVARSESRNIGILP